MMWSRTDRTGIGRLLVVVMGSCLTAVVLGMVGPPATSATLLPVVTETGRISFSIDGLGTNDPAGGIIDVEKPSGATVRKAFLSCAATGGAIPNGIVTINGTAVNWDQNISRTFFFNTFADVTTIVKPTIDAAAAGRVPMTVAEGSSTSSVDGCALGVVLDDPGQTADSSAIVLFGAQESAGDSFAITLATPLDLTDPTSVADMGLAISFSAQDQSGPAGSHQCGTQSAMDSQIDVNGTRLTSCAGNADDGVGTISDGLLFTVGGLDDSNDNPADPFQRAADGETPRVRDDELYNLKPFVHTGETLINVNTINPSNDDNIFVAYFRTSVPSVIGEGIVLAPLTATNDLGVSHTLTATVVDDHGTPIVGRNVTFTVHSGPNAGTTGTRATDVFGKATFTYTGSGGAGTDVADATMTDSHEMMQTSNSVSKLWVSFDPFGGIVRTPRRNITLHLTRPSPDTDAVRCAETDPANPDFDDIPFTPFPDGSVDIDITLSPGDGTKNVCCEYRYTSESVSAPICDSIILATGMGPPPGQPPAPAPAMSWPVLVLTGALLLGVGRVLQRSRSKPRA